MAGMEGPTVCNPGQESQPNGVTLRFPANCRVFRKSFCPILCEITSFLSLALLLLCHGYATSHAKGRKENWKHANCCGAPNGGGVDAGLRRRRREPCTASAATSSFHRGDGGAEERIGAAGKYDGVFSEGREHNGHGGDVEREWNSGWKFDAGNHHTGWHVRRACGPAFTRDRTDHGDEPCGCDEIRHGCDHGDERHHAVTNAESGERGARRQARFYRADNKRRASGYRDAVEPLGCGVLERMRNRGCERKLHRA
jgi:hypothetical protein